MARGDDRPDSDVDFLYVPGSGAMAYEDLLDMQDEQVRLLGRSVDLVPKRGLHWVIKDRVLADARLLYAA